MKTIGSLFPLVGNWHGVNRLEDPYTNKTAVSDLQATIVRICGGEIVRLDYIWFYNDQQQSGSILFATAKGGDGIQSVWIDSFHSSSEFLISAGTIVDGTLRLSGFYAAGGSADWGWNTSLVFTNDTAFTIQMDNVAPSGESEPAVTMTFDRRTE